MTIKIVGKTASLVEDYKSWDGAAWFRYHVQWLRAAAQQINLEKSIPKGASEKCRKWHEEQQLQKALAN